MGHRSILVLPDEKPLPSVLKNPKGNLSRVMRHIDGLHTQRFNRHHRRDGPLFRGRYKAILVDEDEYLAQVVRYIHLNPIEASVVKQPEEYHWSSHMNCVLRHLLNL
jgi:putative transposase